MHAFLLNLHSKITDTPPGAVAKRFWKNIVPAFVGEGSVALISLGVYVLAIRFLGPEEFGRWSLVASMGELLAIVPLWGLAAAALVYLGKDESGRGVIIGTAVRTTIILSFIFFPIYVLVEPILSPLIRLESTLYTAAVIYALFILWNHLSQAFFKGVDKFKILSVFLISSAVIFAGVTFFFLLVLDTVTFESLFWGNIARTTVLILAGAFVFRRSLFRFSNTAFKTLTSYGTLSMASVLLGFFSLSSIDNLMINHYLGTESVGIYAAYFMVFGLLVGKVLGTASQVFLPLVSGITDIRTLFAKSLSLLAPSSVVLLVGSFLLTWIAFIFYGERFDFNPGMAALVAAAATIYFLKSPFESILASRGVPGIKFGPPVAGMLAFLNVMFNILLIPIWGLHGAALGTALSGLITLLFILYLIKRHFT
ncbi:hypothetical protein CL652_01350 [bacterium]|nr:hypothetical protein [bacterium]|tara:strand:+ start:80 stop:1351 length:1272 start_codon:yes stop_codon:yes gene_type:complete